MKGGSSWFTNPIPTCSSPTPICSGLGTRSFPVSTELTLVVTCGVTATRSRRRIYRFESCQVHYLYSYFKERLIMKYHLAAKYIGLGVLIWSLGILALICMFNYLDSPSVMRIIFIALFSFGFNTYCWSAFAIEKAKLKIQ